MRVAVYNQKGEKAGTTELLESVFGLKWNADLVYQVVTSQAANRRPTIAHTKSRGEVRGGGRKPWVQKGTGRARHGSIRSPIWIGGGVTHGPRKERSYKKKINKKMARKALFTALSAKARDKEIVVLDDLKFDAPRPEGARLAPNSVGAAKTKYAAALFAALKKQKELGRITRGNGVLIALSGKDENARRALRNLPYVGIDEARNLNAWEVMQYKYVLFPKEALGIFGKAS